MKKRLLIYVFHLYFQDTHTSAWYVFITTSSAFGLFLDVLCIILVTFVTFSFLLINSGIFKKNRSD